jgi:hypothetical protein
MNKTTDPEGKGTILMSEPDQESPNPAPPRERTMGLYIAGGIVGTLMGTPVGCAIASKSASYTWDGVGEFLVGTLFGLVSGLLAGILIVWVVCKLVKD